MFASPVSLRPTQPTYAYAGLVMHGLFFVPQVKKAVARYRPPVDEKARDLGFMTPPKTGPGKLLVQCRRDLVLIA